MNYPNNIWVINEEDIRDFGYNGGKVIYIADEPNPEISNNPFIVTAGVLLPPFEAIQAELDDNIEQAIGIYEMYLSNSEANMYIISLVAAALKQIPIGILFGRDEKNMQFPNIFINFLYKYYGIVLGIKNMMNPYIEYSYMPIILAKLYSFNLIDYPTFFLMHPIDLPIQDYIISKLVFEVQPLVDEKTHECFKKYFEEVVKYTRSQNRFIEDTMKGVY